MIAHPAMLDVSRELVSYVSRLLRRHREAIGTPRGSRALTCWKQAVFVLVWMRSKPNLTVHGAAFGISFSTAYRYLHEAIDVLADQATDLHEALDQAVSGGLGHLVLDGKVFAADRCRIKTVSVKGRLIDEWYSGKTGAFGGNVQGLARPDGLLIWTSPVEPGHMVDIEAARLHVLPALYPRAGLLPTLADPGYRGAGHGVIVPTPRPGDGNVLSQTNRTHNTLQRSLRCLGERGFALLVERWRALKHTSLSPSRIGDLVAAALVLTHFEHRLIS